jgi:cytoskeleton protein RodZ
LSSFGEKLKREREKRKISLDEIALSTKIGTRMLHALEEEKFDQLPGGIFNKGFVRAYARHVGLDEDQAVADYLEAAGEGAPSRLEASPEVRILPARESERDEPGKGLPWGILAAALLVLALALSVWSYLGREHQESSAPAPVRAATRPDGIAAQPAIPAQGAPPTASGAQGTPVAHPPSAILQAKPITSDAPTAGGFSITVKANDDSWIAIAADGQTVLPSALLSSGSTRTIQASREVVIKAGNVGALEISFNGKQLAPQGREGEVKTLTFNGAGLVAAPSGAKPAGPPG